MGYLLNCRPGIQSGAGLFLRRLSGFACFDGKSPHACRSNICEVINHPKRDFGHWLRLLVLGIYLRLPPRQCTADFHREQSGNHDGAEQCDAPDDIYPFQILLERSRSRIDGRHCG